MLSGFSHSLADLLFIRQIVLKTEVKTQVKYPFKSFFKSKKSLRRGSFLFVLRKIIALFFGVAFNPCDQLN